jgi:LysM repeat protein
MFAKLLGIVLIAAVVAVIAARESVGAGPERVYVVQPADTLWSIAVRHYGGDPREGVWKLEHRNHLARAEIRPGQRLVLPGH